MVFEGEGNEGEWVEAEPQDNVGITVSAVDTEFILAMEEQAESTCLIEQTELNQINEATWSWTETDMVMNYKIKAGQEDEYTIFFYNCNPGSRVTFDLEIDLYNLYDGEKCYLSAGNAIVSRLRT